MKNSIFITFSIIFTFASSLAQNQKGLVHYTDVESLGAPGANLKAFNAVLYFTPEVSLYVTKVDSLENGGKNISKTYEDADGSLKGISSSSTPHGLFNIQYRNENRLVSNARFKSNFTYEEKIPTLDWKITKKSKKIGGLKVIKATTNFRGRIYTAWFAPEIAVPLGPWKLHGLPGLILEAYDNDKEMLFIFEKLEYPYKGKIQYPKHEGQLPGLDVLKEEQDKNYADNMGYMRALGEQFNATPQTKGKESEYLARYLEIFE